MKAQLLLYFAFILVETWISFKFEMITLMWSLLLYWANVVYRMETFLTYYVMIWNVAHIEPEMQTQIAGIKKEKTIYI